MQTELELCYFSNKDTLAEYAGLECRVKVAIVGMIGNPKGVSFDIPLAREEPLEEYASMLVEKPIPLGDALLVVKRAADVAKYIEKQHDLLTIKQEEYSSRRKNTVINNQRKIEFMRKGYAPLSILYLSSLTEFSEETQLVESCKIYLKISDTLSDENHTDIQEYFLNILTQNKDFFLLHHATQDQESGFTYYSDAFTSYLAEHFLHEKKPVYAKRIDARTFTLYHRNLLKFQDFSSQLTSRKWVEHEKHGS